MSIVSIKTAKATNKGLAWFVRSKALEEVIQKGLAEEFLRKQLAGLLTSSSTKVLQGIYQETLDALDKANNVDEAIKYMQTRIDLLPQKARRLTEDKLQTITEDLYKSGFYHAQRGIDLKLSLSLIDKDAMNIIGQQNLFWIGHHYTDDVKIKIDDLLNQYYKEGFTRSQFAANIKEQLSVLTDHNERYWLNLADHMATKIRELGRVSTYEQGGIEYVKVKAILDDRTSDICRDMHGRVISVKRLVDQRDEILGATSKMNLMDAAKWIPEFKGQTSDLPAGVGMPPYHWRCRTITAAFFEGVSNAGRTVTYYDGADKKIKDSTVSTVYNKKIGKEFVLTEGGMRHINRHGLRLSASEAEAALRDVSKWGENADHPGQWVLLSRDDTVLVLRDNVVYTAFRPDNPLEYFKTHTMSGKGVRKWLKFLLKSI